MILTLIGLIKALISLMVMSNAYSSLKKIEHYFLGKANWLQTDSHRDEEPWPQKSRIMDVEVRN